MQNPKKGLALSLIILKTISFIFYDPRRGVLRPDFFLVPSPPNKATRHNNEQKRGEKTTKNLRRLGNKNERYNISKKLSHTSDKKT